MTRICRIGMLLLVATAVMAGCRGQVRTSDEDVQRLLYPDLVDMLAERGKDAPLLVDVRLPDQYRNGHLPRAINVPLPALHERHPILNSGRKLIIYSNGWVDALSTSAAKKLIMYKYDRDKVYDFRGGIDYWLKQGGKLVRE